MAAPPSNGMATEGQAAEPGGDEDDYDPEYPE
jgi:hypothetical protein